ncbi:hypothetical protein JOC69_002475 [Heliobacterium gestii]|nr:hypothetical protein [Heliomicrobium gestii]
MSFIFYSVTVTIIALFFWKYSESKETRKNIFYIYHCN